MTLSILSVYIQVLDHDFINFDDDIYITDNKHIQNGLTVESITWAFTNFHYNFWYPLTLLSFMLDFEIYGLYPGGFHLTNILFHITNALLLFFIFNRMTNAIWRSAFVAFLFAMHPLHVESVAWVTERKDVLSAFFGFLTIWAYLNYTESPSLKRYSLIMLAFICGLMSKLMFITLPFALFLLDFWPLGRLNFAQSNQRSQPMPATRIVWEKVPLFIPVALLCSLTIFISHKNKILPSLESLPADLRISNALVTYIKYIMKMIWPNPMAILYSYPKSINIWKAVGAGLLLISISFITTKKWRRFPYLVVGWLWYLGTLVPVIGLVGAGPMADRYTYVPLIGLFIIIAWGIPDLMQTWRYKKLIIIISLCVVIPASMISTWFQAGLWHSNITLYEHTINVTTNNYTIHNNLGLAFNDQGRFNEAIIHYSRALEIKPDYALAHNNMGSTLLMQKKTEEAIIYYKEAIRIKPDYEMAYNNLGIAMENMNKFNEAFKYFSKAAEINPDDAESQYNLGRILVKLEKIDKGILHYSEAIRIDPNFEMAYNNLTIILEEQGMLYEALDYSLKALRLNIESFRIRYNMGRIMTKLGKTDEAIHNYRKAIELKTDNEMAYYNLGNALFKKGNINEAIEKYFTAIKIKPDYADAHNNLGFALANQGKLKKAIVHYSKAIEIRPDYEMASNNLKIALENRE